MGPLLTGSPVSPADCREILLPMMTDQLKYHLERQEDLEACCHLLSNILEVLYRKDVVSNGCGGKRAPASRKAHLIPFLLPVSLFLSVEWYPSGIFLYARSMIIM